MSLVDTVRRALVTALVHHGVGEVDALATTETVLQWVLDQEGGLTHYLPAVGRRQRQCAIRAALEAGMTPRDISLAHGVSERHVYRIKSGSLGRADWDLQLPTRGEP